MKNLTQNERKKEIRFAIGMAAIDGGQPSDFTKKLLSQYEHGQITSTQLKQAILKQYTKVEY